MHSTLSQQLLLSCHIHRTICLLPILICNCIITMFFLLLNCRMKPFSYNRWLFFNRCLSSNGHWLQLYLVGMLVIRFNTITLLCHIYSNETKAKMANEKKIHRIACATGKKRSKYYFIIQFIEFYYEISSEIKYLD